MYIVNCDCSEEIWKIIPGWENYEASSCGRIRRSVLAEKVSGSLRGRVLSLNKSGPSRYYSVSVYKHRKRLTMRIHKLVAITFLEDIENKTEINHKDGNRYNNHVSNLEYVTHKENMEHAFRLGLLKCPVLVGSTNGSSKLTEDNVKKIKNMLAEGETVKDISKLFGVSTSAIHKVKRGESWSHVLH